MTSVEYTALHRPIYVLDNLFREGGASRCNFIVTPVFLHCSFTLISILDQSRRSITLSFNYGNTRTLRGFIRQKAESR